MSIRLPVDRLSAMLDVFQQRTAVPAAILFRAANTVKTLIFAALIGMFTGPLAYAQATKSVIPDLNEVSRKGDMARLEELKKKERFKAADEDANGVLSRKELAKHFPYIEKHFEKYDTNKDGVLSWEEFSAPPK